MSRAEATGPLDSWLARLDPCDHPDAPRFEPSAVLVTVLLALVSAGLFLEWKVAPYQDLGHHVAMSAVVTRYGEAGSLYPAIYKPLDPLNANSLLYFVSGNLGKVVGASLAFRLCVSSYLALTPVATLYMLRAFGRPAWGAVAAVPLAYNLAWVYGFANFVFAAPLLLAGFTTFVMTLRRPSGGRAAAAAALLAATFLAHVHVFGWLVVLCAGATCVGVVGAATGRLDRRPTRVARDAALVVAPSLLLAARWARRAFSTPPSDELALVGTGGTTLRAIWSARRALGDLLADLPGVAAVLPATRSDGHILLALLSVAVLSTALSLRGRASRPWPELACVAALASYFVLPEHVPAQSVIGSRHIGIALWFAPAFFTPVPADVSRRLRGATIVAVILLSVEWLYVWRSELAQFHATEGRGLERVLAATPPRARLYYVNHLDATSRRFPFNVLWHVDKWSMADAGAQCPDNPAYGQMNPLRYRASYPLHRAILTSSWPTDAEIHDNFDAVLIARWRPGPADLEAATRRYELLAHEGEFWLWRRR